MTELQELKAKYTPGPWVENPDNDCVWNVDTGGDNFYSFIGPEGEAPIAISIVDSAFSRDEEMAANACLIAAAPDLHAAAKDALSGWRYIRQQHGDLSGVGWDRVEAALAEALAKAESRANG